MNWMKFNNSRHMSEPYYSITVVVLLVNRLQTPLHLSESRPWICRNLPFFAVQGLFFAKYPLNLVEMTLINSRPL